MPETPVVYEDVEVLDDDGLGFTCRIGDARAFIGKYVPVNGTTVRRKGDRGRLTLPRWFVEQQGLPLKQRMTDRELEEWYALALLHVAAATEAVALSPGDATAQAALEHAQAQLAAALAIRARRNNPSR